MEKFETIKEFPDYEISNYGRVRSKERFIRFTHAVTKQEHFRRSECKYLKVNYNKHGYRVVCLYLNKKMYNKTIHRLVAETFIDKIDGKNVVNHKDGNKHNNTVDNLEWVTDEYNHAHATITGLKRTKEKLNETCVYAIKNLIKSNLSHSKIASIFGVSASLITQIATGKLWLEVLPSEQQINFEEKDPSYLGKKVQLINDKGSVLNEWKSLKEAGRELGLDPGMIGKVATGKHKNYKGNKFKFALTGEELTIK